MMKTLCLAALHFAALGLMATPSQVVGPGQVLALGYTVDQQPNGGMPPDLGTTDVGGLKTLSLTVTNDSSLTLANVTWTLDGPDAGDFVLDAAGCSSLAPGASGVVRLSFMASVEGKVSQAALHPHTGRPEVAEFPVNLTAKAGRKRLPVRIEEVGGAEFTALSPAYDFGQPMLGQTVYKTFRMTNLGTAPLHPVSLQIDETSYSRLPWRAYIPEYQGYTEQSGFYLSDASLAALAPGESTTFTVRWQPYETTTKLKHVVINGDNIAVLGGVDPPLPILSDFGAESRPTGQVMIPITGGAVANVVPTFALAGLHYRMGNDSSVAGEVYEMAVTPEWSELQPDMLLRWGGDTSAPTTPFWNWHQQVSTPLQLHANNTNTPPFPMSKPLALLTGSTASTAESKLNSIAATFFHDGVWHSNANLRLPATDKVGMELWLKPERLTGTQCVAFMGTGADAGFGLWLVDGVLEGRAGVTQVRMATALTTADWHHVAFIVSDHTASLHVDGVEVASAPGVGLPTEVKGFGVGAMVDGTSPYDGLVDELRLFEVPATGFDAATQLVANAQPSASLSQSTVEFGDVEQGKGSSAYELSPFNAVPSLINAGPGWLRILSVSITGDAAADYRYQITSQSVDPPEPVSGTGSISFTSVTWINSLTVSRRFPLLLGDPSGADSTIPQGFMSTSLALKLLAPRSRVRVDVSHAAGTAGDRPATLRIVTNDPVNPVLEIRLHARTLPARPKLTFSAPRELNWGSLKVGQQMTQVLTLYNQGNAAAQVRFSITGPNAEDVQLSPRAATVPVLITASIPPDVPITPNSDLAGWKARSLNLIIQPKGIGLRLATLRLETSDPDLPLVEVPIYGVVPLPAPRMEVYDEQAILSASTPVAFGQVFAGRSADHYINVRNVGKADLHLTRLTVEGEHAADFTLNSYTEGQNLLDGLPAAIAPQAAWANGFNVRFTPQGSRTRKAILKIESDDPAQSVISLPLIGTGLAAAAQLSVVQPAHVLFGSSTTPLSESFIRLGTGVVRGYRKADYTLPTQRVPLRNTGVRTMANAQITFTGEAAGDFSGVISEPIAVDGTGELVVTFNPTATGPRSAVMHITSEAMQVDVPVGGTGAYGEKASLLPALPQGWSTTAMVELADHSIILAGHENGGYRLIHATADGYQYVGQGSAMTFSGPIQSLAVNAKGELLVGGIFSSISGQTQPQNVGGVSVTSVTNWNLPCEGVVLITTDGQFVTDFHTPGRGLLASPMDRFSCYACVALPDGRYLVGGSGALEGRHHLVRLNADGTVDTTFTLPEPDGPVNALALQDDGKVLVGGIFTNLGQAYQPAQRRDPSNSARLYGGLTETSGSGDIIAGTEAGLCRLNTDGTNDTTFGNPGVGMVTALAVRGNRIAIGGTATWSTGVANTTGTRNVVYLTDEYGRIRAFTSPEVPPRAVAVQSGNRLLFTPGNQYGEMHLHPAVAMIQPRDEAADWWGVKQVFTDGLPALPAVVQNPSYRVQEFDGYINTLLAQADGKVLVGGSLTAARVAVDTDAGGFEVPASLAESNPAFWSSDDTPSSMPLRGFAQLDVDGFFNSVIPEPGLSDGLSAIDVYATHPLVATTAAINTSATTLSAPDGSVTFNPTFWPRITMPDPAAGATWFIDGPDAAAFSLRDAGLMRPAYVGAPLVMDVMFTPLHTSAHRAVLHVNKRGSETMDIALENGGASALPPGIAITAVSKNGLSASLDPLDFGWANDDATVIRTLRMTNTGSTAFSGPLSLSIAGINATDFTLTRQPVYPIAPGGSTEFTITFKSRCASTLERLANLLVGNAVGQSYIIPLKGTVVLRPRIPVFPQRQDFVLLKDQSATVNRELPCQPMSMWTWQWFFGSVPLRNATSSSYTISHARPFEAGTYSVQVTNTIGAFKTEAMRVAVIDMEAKTVTSQPGKPLQLECIVAGKQPVTYQWSLNGQVLSGSAFTGVTTAKLTIKSVALAHAGNFTCAVTLGTASQSSPPITLRLDLPPVMTTGLSTTNWRVTQPVTDRLTADSVSPVAIFAQGLPPGVVLNSKTGTVSGRPTKAGTYRVRFQAWNVRGHSSIVDQTITVLPWAPGFVGTFYGPIMLTGGDTIGDWTLVAAGNGSFTARLRAGSQWLPAGKDRDGEPIFGGIVTTSFTGSLTFVPESDLISHAQATVVKDDIEQLDVVITITNGVPHAQFTRVRPNDFVTAGEAAPAMRSMPSRYAGTYACALNGRGVIDARPLAKSSMRFTVGTNRVFTWSANLGSAFGGLAFTGSCPVMDDGNGVPCGNIFTVVPTIDGGYALSGKAVADADSSPLTFSGQLGWPAGSLNVMGSPINQWFEFIAKR